MWYLHKISSWDTGFFCVLKLLCFLAFMSSFGWLGFTSIPHSDIKQQKFKNSFQNSAIDIKMTTISSQRWYFCEEYGDDDVLGKYGVKSKENWIRIVFPGKYRNHHHERILKWTVNLSLIMCHLSVLFIQSFARFLFLSLSFSLSWSSRVVKRNVTKIITRRWKKIHKRFSWLEATFQREN